MTLKTQIQADMKTALKAADKERLKVVRLILAAIKQQEVDNRIELDDEAVLAVLTKMVKQRRDSVSQFTDGGRQDLADIEEREITVLETYLPAPLSEQEISALIESAVTETGAETMADMGRVMGFVKGRAAGRADLGRVSALVKARLS